MGRPHRRRRAEPAQSPGAGFALDAPDADAFPLVEGRVVTVAGWQRASYDGLAELLGTVTTGDTVTAEMLASADVLAFELNGGHPAFSGGWESCNWEFRDAANALGVSWNEATVGGVFLGPLVPRDSYVVANGSITGGAYGSFFDIPNSIITGSHPTLTPETVVVSFLLFPVRDEIDVTSADFTVTLSGVPHVPGVQESGPEVDAIGLLLHPGAAPARPVRPKKSAARRVKELCHTFGVKESIVPALAAMWERHRAGQPGRNAFESGIHEVFAGFDPQNAAAMDRGFAGYRAFRAGGTDTCFFRDGLADAVAVRPLERAEFVTELLHGGAAVSGMQLFNSSDGVIGPGLVRPWGKVLSDDPDGFPVVVVAPWPRVTAIKVDSSSSNEFGTTASYGPNSASSPPHPWEPYQFAQSCRFTLDPAGQVVMDCDRTLPSALPGDFVGSCEGGADYTLHEGCLRIPSQSAGGSICLRGVNFTTPSVEVHLRRKDAPAGAPALVQECLVRGDQDTALTDAQGTVIADLRVKDWVDVPVPLEHPTQPGAPFPPGLYDVWVTVRDTTDPAQPVVRESNRLLLRVEPGPDVQFLIRSDRGRCIEETPGWGDDEIWWDAFVGEVSLDGTPPVLARKPFPREH